MPVPWTGPQFEFEHPSTPRSRVADLLSLARQLGDDEFDALIEMLHTTPRRNGRARGYDDAAALREVRRLIGMIWNTR